jgi:hypothetical protein
LDAKTKTVKVKAFPIAAQMTIGASVHAGQILKLTASGFLFEAQSSGLKTGEKFQISFELPVLHHAVVEPCVIVKIYTTAGSQVIEGHFQSVGPENEKKILKFLSAIPKATA